MTQSKKAFAVFALIIEGKIKNIAFSEVNNGSDAYKTLVETHQRIGTVHAENLYVSIHKGFAGKDAPDGNKYGVSEKTKYIPFGETKAYRLMLRIKKNDIDIARDGKGNVILEPITKQPMLVQKSSIVFGQIVPAEDKAKVDELLKDYMAMPCTLYTGDADFSFTLYTPGDKKLFLRPGKYFGSSLQAAQAPAPVAKEQVVEAEAINDDLPF